MDVTILPYGTPLHAFVAQDYTGSTTTHPCVRNRIFLTTSRTCGKYFYEDGTFYGVLAPSYDQVTLCVEKMVWENVSEGDKIFIGDLSVDCGTFEVTGKNKPDAYLNCYSLIFDYPGAEVEDYVYCVPYVRISNYEVEGGSPQKYPFCTNSVLDDIVVNGETAIPLRVSITSKNYVDVGSEITYIYIVAEAVINKRSQLFLYETYAQKWLGSGADPSCPFTDSGWIQLTNSGENKNPKICLDASGSLHVFWEGTRDSQTQIYYTTLGPATLTAPHAALASALDKQAEFLHKKEDERPDTYVEKLATVHDAIDIGIVKGCSSQAANTMWMAAASDSGVNVGNNSEIRISGNPSTSQAMAWTIIDKDEVGVGFGNSFVQRQYEVSFNLKGNLPCLTDGEIAELYSNWKNQFTQVESESFNNAPLYEYGKNKMVLGKVDKYYDRFVPLFGSYRNPNLPAQFATCSMETTDEFSAIITGSNSTVQHYMIGLMPEKVRFAATNIQSFSEYCDSIGKTFGECQESYKASVDEVVYTGRYKMIVIMSPDNFFYGSEDYPDYALVRQVSEPFCLDQSGKKFRIYTHYGKLSLEEAALGWAHKRASDGTNNEYHKYLCTLFVALDDTIEFAESFFVDFCTDGTIDQMDFRVALGWPSKGEFQSNVFLPYETSVFDYQSVDWTFTNIKVGAPNIEFNTDYVVLPEHIRSLSHMNITDFHPTGFGTPCTAQSFWTDTLPKIKWYNLGADYYTTPEIPITLEGVNISPSLSMGIFCRDLHLTWQSNRDRFWNVYYTNGSNPSPTLPFRFETQITATESNSLSPSIAVSKEGDRVIAWHDNRDGDFYQIYAARGTPDSKACNCSDQTYLWEQQLLPEPVVNQVPIEVDGTDLPKGTVHYRITFYADSERKSIIHSAFSLDDQRRWFVDDSPPAMLTTSGNGVGEGTSKAVWYVPEIQPAQYLENQYTHTISTWGKDKPLLCGVKYYVTVEVFYVDSSIFLECMQVEYTIPCSQVDTGVWRENGDLNNWQCSGQGKQDRRISTTSNQCTFPSVACNFQNQFVFAWTDFRNNNPSVRILDYYPEIYYGYWDLGTDIVWSSGSGKGDSRMFPKGYRCLVNSDPAGLFNFVTYYDDKIPFYAGPLTTTSSTTEYSCLLTDDSIYNLDEVSTNPDQYMKLRVYEQDSKGSFVLNADKVVSIVQDCLVRLDVVGLPGSYAVRLRNEEDTDWSDWIKIGNRRVDQILGYDATGKTEGTYMSAYFIEQERFVVPWALSAGSGMKRVCLQLLTYFGISRTFCLDMLLNIEEMEYQVSFYLDSALTAEVPVYNGYPVVKGKVYFTVTFNDKDRLKFYIDKMHLLNEDKYGDLIATLTYNVIQQGDNDLLSQTLTNVSEGVYKGDFELETSDGIFNKDGLGAIVVNIPNPCTRMQKILPGAGTSDFYNLMNLNILRDFYVKYDNIFLDLTPEELLEEYKSSGLARVVSLVPLYEYYKADDPRFMFGDPKFFIQKKSD